MSIKKVLQVYASRRWILPEPMLPVAPRMATARETVEQRLSALYAQASVIDLEDLHRRLCKALAINRWEDISGRDWRHASHCLSMGTPPLINDIRFLDVYLARLAINITRPSISGLIRCYLLLFNPNHPGIRRIASFLHEQVGRWRWEWSESPRRDTLFHSDTAPRWIAAHAWRFENPGDSLTKLGFKGSLAGARLAGHAYLEALGIFRRKFEQAPSVDQLCRITEWGVAEQGVLRYGSIPEVQGRLAEAILLPWVNREPMPEVREYTERFLLNTYKDPRISPARWRDVSEDAMRVIRRWLTKASLAQFLDVVDKTATDAAARRMWPARRRFWEAFYTKGFLQEAWVVFARNGEQCARNLASDGLCFGKLRRGVGTRNDHAILIMRIGDLTVVDWNHTGYCHIWLPDNRKAPRLYGATYGRTDLSAESDFQKIHSGAWQHSVYYFIRRYTGVSMQTREYLP